MFCITAETCRSFTFSEVLIMAALNFEINTRTSAARERANAATAQSPVERRNSER